MPLRSPGEPGRQLSLFGVEAADPSLADVAGLLAGPGRLARMGGTARLSVHLDLAWRVHALIPELVTRGLVATWRSVVPTLAAPGDDFDRNARMGDGVSTPLAAAGFEVRTAYSRRLASLSQAWLDGTAKRVPDRFFLTGPRLRLWVLAAGAPVRGGYLLRLGAQDGDACWARVAEALQRLGVMGSVVPGETGEPETGEPAYRVIGRRSGARLAELVGGRPVAVPDGAWPDA